MQIIMNSAGRKTEGPTLLQSKPQLENFVLYRGLKNFLNRRLKSADFFNGVKIKCLITPIISLIGVITFQNTCTRYNEYYTWGLNMINHYLWWCYILSVFLVAGCIGGMTHWVCDLDKMDKGNK